MTTTVQRLILGVLGLTGAVVGGWATVLPREFYDSFPGFGRFWVSVDGPFNEHQTRDVGAAYSALAVLSLLALARADQTLVRAAGSVWLVFGALHFSYHLPHLGIYDTTDQVLNVLSLGGSVVVAALLLLPVRTPAEGARS